DVFRSFVTDRVPVRVISNLVETRPRKDPGRLPEGDRAFIPSAGSRFKGSDVVPDLISGIDQRIREQAGKTVEFLLSGKVTDAMISEIRRSAPGAKLIAPGHLPHDEILNHLSVSRVCVSPTWVENQSMALLEAKALGVPFVTFDV